MMWGRVATAVKQVLSTALCRRNSRQPKENGMKATLCTRVQNVLGCSLRRNISEVQTLTFKENIQGHQLGKKAELRANRRTQQGLKRRKQQQAFTDKTHLSTEQHPHQRETSGSNNSIKHIILVKLRLHNHCNSPLPRITNSQHNGLKRSKTDRTIDSFGRNEMVCFDTRSRSQLLKSEAA